MLKAGLIGMGWWGTTLLTLMQGNAFLRFVAATDLDPSRRALADTHGLTFASDFEAVLRMPEVEAVVICTPHALHPEQIRRAAAAGKHVFCEKPLCLTLRDADMAVQACADAGVVLGVGHERRFEPPIVELARRIRAGDLGRPLQIEGNFSQDKFLDLPADNWRIRGPGSVGPLTATGIHILDLAISLLGPASTVHARLDSLATDFENGDTLAIMAGFEGGATAMISAILATPFDGRFAVYGSEGWAEIRDRSHPENSQGWVATYALRGREREVIDYPGEPAARLNLEAFARAAKGGTPYPVPQAQMIQTVAAVEAVMRSGRSGEITRVG